MSFPKRITIEEVGPREGWQSLCFFVPTETKVKLIKAIIDSGAEYIQISMLPNPKIVPQFADTEKVTAQLFDYAKEKGVIIDVGNLSKKRFAKMQEMGLIEENVTYRKGYCGNIPISNSHSLENFHMSVDAFYEKFANTVCEMKERGETPGRGTIGCAFGSPSGDATFDDTMRCVEFMLNLGITEIHMADTDGMSSPDYTKKVVSKVKELISPENICLHLHDTAGFGIVNAYVALEEGVSKFDACIGGMGGCPFIPEARGNLATEDLIYMANKLGIETNLDFEKTLAVSQLMRDELKVDLPGYMIKLAGTSLLGTMNVK